MSKDCINCDKRYPGCHSKCEAYKEWRAKFDKRNDVIKANKQRELHVAIYRKELKNETGET